MPNFGVRLVPWRVLYTRRKGKFTGAVATPQRRATGGEPSHGEEATGAHPPRCGSAWARPGPAGRRVTTHERFRPRHCGRRTTGRPKSGGQRISHPNPPADVVAVAAAVVAAPVAPSASTSRTLTAAERALVVAAAAAAGVVAPDVLEATAAYVAAAAVSSVAAVAAWRNALV